MAFIGHRKQSSKGSFDIWERRDRKYMGCSTG
jgi:hypothetical protein